MSAWWKQGYLGSDQAQNQFLPFTLELQLLGGFILIGWNRLETTIEKNAMFAVWKSILQILQQIHLASHELQFMQKRQDSCEIEKRRRSISELW